jgi:hypothetical protein
LHGWGCFFSAAFILALPFGLCTSQPTSKITYQSHNQLPISQPTTQGQKCSHNGNAENSAGEKLMLHHQFPCLALSLGGAGSSWSALRSDAFLDKGRGCRRRNQIQRAEAENLSTMGMPKTRLGKN